MLPLPHLLYDIQHGITHRVNNNIYIYHGIRAKLRSWHQTKSLVSKEDSQVRNTDPQQCACLLSHLGLQHHAATTETSLLPHYYISDLSSKLNHSPIRSVHIKPSPVEIDTTYVLLGLPRGKPRNPVNRKLTTHHS